MEQNARPLNVVFASAEAAPFVKTGGLGDVAGSLPHALKEAGANVIVMVPKYDTIAAEYKNRMEHLCEFYVPLGWRNEYCGLERLNWKGVDYIFLDNERYFGRGYPYGFFDDGERFAFFSKAVVESLQHLPEGFTCDILHCNDWHTAMAPVFLREFYQALPLYQNVRTVFSIHNIAFQGQYSAKVLNDILGLAHIPAASYQLTCGPDAINYMQGALNYTDAITTVSPTYAAEIQTPEYGEHLDGILRRRSGILTGIVNGIDLDSFNPATDQRIAANYTRGDRSGKAECKRRLQEELGLEVRDDRPLMVMVTRLTRQKGLDLVTYALDRILSGGVQVAVLGTGDADYENALRYFEGKYPGTMAARIQFDAALSQRMYAGADMFLMPSLFEPCGLSQMIAMRYGTLPIVRETGGLKDTVQPYNQFTGEGTGFSFANFNGDEMADTVFRAARLFWDDRKAWNKLVDNAMDADFSWEKSANTYLDVYYGLHPELPRFERPKAKPTRKAAPRKRATARKSTSTKTPSANTAAKKSPAPKPASKAAAKSAAADSAATPQSVAAAPTAATSRSKKAAAKPVATTATATAQSSKPDTAAAAATTASASVPAASKKAPSTSAAGTAQPAKPAKPVSASAKKAVSAKTASKAKAATETEVKAEPAPKTSPQKKPAQVATKPAPAKPAAAKPAAAKPAAAKTVHASKAAKPQQHRRK